MDTYGTYLCVDTFVSVSKHCVWQYGLEYFTKRESSANYLSWSKLLY